MQSNETLDQFELREDTLKAIEAPLMRRQDNGYTRGLFTPEQMHEIRQALHNLAHWLAAKQASANTDGGPEFFGRTAASPIRMSYASLM